MARRRMSEAMKMAASCSKDCLEQAGIEQSDAIIVGTSSGPGVHTRQFMDKIVDSDGEMISPSAFITSVHNTYAGQLSLLIENHSYNNTHSHGSLSFELALLDAMLCIDEGRSNVQVGAVDEYEEALHNIKGRLGSDKYPCTYGASFFLLSGEADARTRPVSLVNAGSYGRISDFNNTLIRFLEEKGRIMDDVDLVLYSESDGRTREKLESIFKECELIDFQQYCGYYLTNSAFAMHYAIDLLLNSGEKKKPGTVLVCNNIIPENLGLILLQKPGK